MPGGVIRGDKQYSWGWFGSGRSWSFLDSQEGHGSFVPCRGLSRKFKEKLSDSKSLVIFCFLAQGSVADSEFHHLILLMPWGRLSAGVSGI